MLALDTNVLVRILIDDPDAPTQCATARAEVQAAGEAYVSQVVQIETVWVLSAAYSLNKGTLLKALRTVLDHPAFHLQRPEVFRAALEYYDAGHADFADCMILVESVAAGAELASFDRKLGKLAGVRLLK
ncbi:MAG: type II toxin-antitoxin system VapC family toxin [Rhodocyclaceae bacterium]|nr:type II toxin-antitoxin system VapC family toxin [Rhodocyclaceae bacterium]MDZ4216091.1 type II toxin-antitoxin system VapC family toxin [Rhodocyclaceae bacterium]